MKIIGITGPTGAGKTTALNVLTALGAQIIDCDEVYHHLLEHSVALGEALTAQFGDIRDDGGHIDRKKLGGVVFGDVTALQTLNTITHRYVAGEIDRQLARAAEEGKTAVAIDAILLIESGLAARCDAVVGILAPVEVRVHRIMARDGISEEYARKRVAAQKDEGFFWAHCTHILENEADDTAETFGRRASLLLEAML